MSKVLDKVLGAIGFEVAEEEFEEEELQEVQAVNDGSWREKYKENRQKKGNLVSLPGQKPTTVMLFKAESFQEVESIAQNVKERRSVIVNFDEVEKETAQRMIDFLSGTVFALEGNVQKVSQSTFLFATSNVDVVGQIMPGEKDRTPFKGATWSRHKMEDF